MEVRYEVKYPNIPVEAGRIVDIIVHKDQLFVACEHSVYILSHNKVWEPMRFAKEVE